ncbi:MAG: DNA (cytosine-5-)-methyltransferase [Candidatus Riesia sp.]|nr:DNA (cytosine-5-)-methyltransferase [Candidatus Riesia sp.]
MKYFSMFSGIGGFELGISRAKPKWECVGYSEIDKYAVQIYKKHFNHTNYGDAKLINTDDLPEFDLLVGGFPCQAFSVAGKQRGFEDTRGTLFFEIARVVKQKQPRLLLLENVKGLLSHDKGNTFKRIISTLDELGYNAEWQVLNSKDFNVPQNRERVFIIGYLRGTNRSEVFPIFGSNKQAIKQVIGGSQGQRVYATNGLSVTLASGAGGQGAKTGLYAIPVLTPDRLNKRQNGRRFKENEEPSFTLTAQDRHGVYDGTRIRRLTPTECERLQGFPDNWTAGFSDTQRYKCLGNAVTVNVIQTIIDRINQDKYT